MIISSGLTGASHAVFQREMDQQRSLKDSLQYHLSDHWTSIDQMLAHSSQLTQLEPILQPHLQSL